MDERAELVVVDLSEVTSGPELHAILARALEFPDFYGRNWNAFWDSITGLVAMPHRLRLVGWSRFEDRMPEETRYLRGCLDEMSQQFPEWASTVEYA
ncbi:barstar family protein [Paludisphaera rhizosphaerae]|uniref:barstar family protein n=1 Tax=Paludisphaera rhizosphaerae TaxID=2711216 RepID=UPI0013EACC3F|nr:barstar family protein [Paludisphaera rhizosphaerae]